MKQSAFLILLFSFVLVFTACRKEETEFVQAPENETLSPNSTIAQLIQQAASNDGSIDNIVSRANCFGITFPFTVTVNNQQITVNSLDDYALVECILDEDENNTDTVNIMFPITIETADYTEIIINNATEFTNYKNTCNGENVADDDIECIDFQYPVEASLFNSENELLDTVSLTTDKALFKFVTNINENDIVTFSFPITVTLADGYNISISDFNALETAITNAINTCDEDDDYDYNDDDCDDCTTTELKDLLTNCTDWEVNRLKRNGNDYNNQYDDYLFNFFQDGTMSVYWDSIMAYGTWTASGSANNLEVIINVPSLPLCNNNWILHEISNCTADTQIDFRVGTDDRIRYYRNCN